MVYVFRLITREKIFKGYCLNRFLVTLDSSISKSVLSPWRIAKGVLFYICYNYYKIKYDLCKFMYLKIFYKKESKIKIMTRAVFRSVKMANCLLPSLNGSYIKI